MFDGPRARPGLEKVSQTHIIITTRSCGEPFQLGVVVHCIPDRRSSSSNNHSNINSMRVQIRGYFRARALANSCIKLQFILCDVQHGCTHSRAARVACDARIGDAVDCFDVAA